MATAQHAHGPVACCGCGSLLASTASTSCRAETKAGVTFSQTGSAEGAVEMDPSRRYIRYPILLGRGACKRVYKAFDLQEGIEVAWNKAELSANDMEPEQQERLFSEIRVLRTLHHRNIITCYEWWHDAASQTINFITEYFTSGNLRQYRKKHLRHISDMAIKRWAFQILEGLLYLHAHSPPIVHRDLKCDNILVNGTSGQVKIADLGLASCQRGMSVVGTPEFMAPEMYDEVYDEKVDIYAFGMCMLELATLEYPYSECHSIPAIFMRVSKGIPPAALAKVSSDNLRELITTCIAHDPQQRPSAVQLLKHTFFADLAERPSGGASLAAAGSTSRHSSVFTPPFGSCGNLMALSHGSVGQQLSHGTHSHSKSQSQAPQGRVSRCSRSFNDRCSEAQSKRHTERNTSGKSEGGVSASGSTAEAAAAAGPQGEASRGGNTRPGTTSEAGSCCSSRTPDSSACGMASGNGVKPTADEGCSLVSSSNGSVPASGVKLIGRTVNAVAAAAGGARGTTVCVAKIGRSDPLHEEEEDSDDEVLVPLEDVLMPHPEDFLDAQALGLTSQLTHASSGCTIMSGPGYELAEGLSGLLDHMVADSEGQPGHGGGMLSRFTSNATLLYQQHLQQQGHLQQEDQLEQQQEQQQQPDTASQQQEVATLPQQQQQQQKEAGSSGAVNHSRQRSTGGSSSKGPSRPSSRLGSISGAAPLLSQCTPGASASAGAAGYRCSSAASERTSTTSGAVTPLHRPTSANTGASAYAGAPGATSATSAAAAAAAAAQMLRSLSNLSSSGGSVLSSSQAAGVLAAAGLLQVSPGCYVPTPPLLEKLLSRAGGPNRATSGWPTWLSQTGSAGAPATPPTTAAGSSAGCNDGSADTAAAAAAAACTDAATLGRVEERGGGAAVQISTGSAIETAEAANYGQQEAASNALSALSLASQQGCSAEQQQASRSSSKTAQRGVAAPAAARGGLSTSEASASAGSCDGQQQQPEGHVPPDGLIRVPTVGALKPGDSCCTVPVSAVDALQDLGTAPVHALAATLSSSKSHRATVDAVPTAVLPVVLPLQEQQMQAVALPLELSLLQSQCRRTSSGQQPEVDVGVPLAAAAAVAMPGQHMAGGVGGFGRILVRRKFVKNMQQTAPHFKRYNSL